MYSVREFFIVFAMGGGTYVLMEMIFRGYSHWSMFITRRFMLNSFLHY